MDLEKELVAVLSAPAKAQMHLLEAALDQPPNYSGQLATCAHAIASTVGVER